MAKKEKRKARKKISKKMDITQPITLEQLGTAEDPCFGKLYDPRTSECSRCGDCEFCAIAMGQLNNISRARVEKKAAFMDMEERDIKVKSNPKEIRKLVKARIYEMVESAGDKGISLKSVAIDIFSTFNKDGWRKNKAIKYIKLLEEKYGKLTLNQNRLLWKSKARLSSKK